MQLINLLLDTNKKNKKTLALNDLNIFQSIEEKYELRNPNNHDGSIHTHE